MSDKDDNNDDSLKGHRQLHVRVKSARGRKNSSTRWLQRQLNDPYVQIAKRDGYRSRAAYKLIELNDKFDFLKNGQNIIDLGAAPGGWTQVCTKKFAGGKIIGIDLQEMEPIPGATLIMKDFTEDEALELIEKELSGKKLDVVLSDMAAPSCGHAPTDHLRIVSLCDMAFEFAKDNLKTGGTFVAKILRGGTEADLLNDMKKNFKKVRHFKPDASRKDSSEMYVIATDYKGK